MEETTSTVPNNKNETKNACNTKTIPEEKYCFCFSTFCPFGKINIDSAMQQETMLTKKLT